MDGLGIGLFILLAATFIVVVGILAAISAKKRREALAAAAAERGWRYAEQDRSLVDRFSGSPFGVGQSRRASNVLTGTHAGRQMVAFDYRYQTTSGTGKNRRTTTHLFSVVAVNLGVRLPALSVTPEGMIRRFIGRLTNTDIELESEDFNRAFTVSCPSRKFASDVLHPRMMELLLTRPDLSWRFDGDSMLVIESGQHEIHEVDATLAVMDAIADQIPEFVWRDLRGGAR